MQHLKIALLQADLVWENLKQNKINFSEKINSISEKVDLIVLPEMFTTGFTMSPERVSEKINGETIKWMQQIATEKKSAICGSIVFEEDKKYYNRFLFVHPSGELEYYNKRHLFTLAGEHKVYTPGTEKLLINYKGFKICPLVCYDLRFPVWARNTNNYDVLLYVANWPKPRISAWDTLLKARAIENMCYTIGVNRVGVDANNLQYNGHTATYNCLGEQITETIEGSESIIMVTLEKKHLTETRAKLNFLNDRDIFEIID